MRSITFGCSFTQYLWPTYASILNARNMGWSGSGNERIFYFVMQQFKRDKFKNFDFVVVQWTSHNRFDYLTPKGWTIPDGPIMLSTHKENQDIWKKIKTWYHEGYEIEKTINYILSVKNLFEANNIPYVFLTMNDIPTLDKSLIFEDDLLSKYRGNYFFNSASWTNQPFTDQHPTIESHIKIAQKIAEHFNYQIPKETIIKYQLLHDQLQRTRHLKDYN